MVDEENGGIVGVFYVLIVYAITTAAAAAACYGYLVHVHMNGRVIDTFSRINADAEDLFVPHDFEVSIEELDHIVAKAKRYLGPADERRHVAVAKYDLKDPVLPDFKETAAHVAIYEQALDGTQKVYRHFLKQHDGTITEIFGSSDAAAVFGTARPLDRGAKAATHAADPNTLPALGGYFSGLRAI